MMVWEEEQYFGIVINITPDLLNKTQEHTRKNDDPRLRAGKTRPR